jgi:hypothetical protein
MATYADRLLAGITEAAETMRRHRTRQGEARDDLRLIVQQAVDVGVPVAHIARAAGWTQRNSVYNILKGN